MRNLSVLLAAAVLLSGCETVRYEMRPPASDAGRACVTQCAGIREVCRGNEIRRAASERNACERRADQSLIACLNRADNEDKKKQCHRNKPGCYVSENQERCEQDYRACYVQCGGTVTRIVE